MISIENIISVLRKKNIPKEKLIEVQKSFELAKDIHKNQYRQSGEPYIIHPLNVANNLLKMEIYDPDSISAALLHDTIEDAEDDFSKEDIAKMINPTVADLVDGVTKMRRVYFPSKDDQNQANTRKIINGIAEDVRIIIIKLADRIHNMETLDFKSPEKQRENAIETMRLYVPLALAIGAYQVKNVLEDLSLKYIEPEDYKRIKEEKDILQETEESYLREIGYKIESVMKEKDIPVDIIYRTQTITTIYKKIKRGYRLQSIYDLFYLKLLVDEIDECFRTLGIVHSLTRPINGTLKDYIYNPRTNMYQSLHTTVSNTKNKLIKVKIRTHEMDKVAAYGIPALWIARNPKTIEETQRLLIEENQFVQTLRKIEDSSQTNEEFIKELNKELLTEHVYAYNYSGDIIELPKGATALDFACKAFPDSISIMTGAVVNGKEVALDRQLKNNDRVEIITTGSINHEKWEECAQTSYAKQKIKALK